MLKKAEFFNHFSWGGFLINWCKNKYIWGISREVENFGTQLKNFQIFSVNPKKKLWIFLNNDFFFLMIRNFVKNWLIGRFTFRNFCF